MSMTTMQLLFTVDGAFKVSNEMVKTQPERVGRPALKGLDLGLANKFLRGKL